MNKNALRTPQETVHVIVEEPYGSEAIGNLSLREVWTAYAEVCPPAGDPQPVRALGSSEDLELAVAAFNAGLKVSQDTSVDKI